MAEKKKAQPRKRDSQPRTASGKRASTQLLATAQADAQEGLRERTEAGHIAAGRTPPSQESAARRSGAVKKVDMDIRTYAMPVTEDEKFLQHRADPTDFTRQDTWRVMRIMSEFIEGFDNLADITKGVTIFGSARTDPQDPQYLAAQETARILAEKGFAIITGAGPGIMEAANRGAHEAGGVSIGFSTYFGAQGVEKPNQYTTHGYMFADFGVRERALVKYTKPGIVVYPGGFGTAWELFQTLSEMQTGKIAKAPIVLVGSEFWKPTMETVKGFLARGTISADDPELVTIVDTPEETVQALERGVTPES